MIERKILLFKHIRVPMNSIISCCASSRTVYAQRSCKQKSFGDTKQELAVSNREGQS
jgi:hypothetical protein